jgi:hypothetical protein
MTEADLERVVGDAAPVLDRVTRLGFATKGLLTVTVGVLALRHALGQGGRLTGQEGAIRTLRDQPFGLASLIVLTVGLSAYALWMFVSAFVDLQGKGKRIVGLVERVAFLVTGIGYAALAFGSVQVLMGGGGSGTELDDLAAGVLTPVFGRWLVGLAGSAVVIAGVLQMRLGITAGFRRDLRQDLSPWWRRMTVMSGRFGYLALGLLSLLVGSSLVRVAMEYDPSEAGGWDEALGLLSRFGEGTWVLAVAAAGLILYGVYFVLLARVREL